MKRTDLIDIIANEKPARSYWGRAVQAYAIDILKKADYVENLPESHRELEIVLLNGADNWRVYSEGGCALIANYDIAERVCTPSEFKRKRSGYLEPNSSESWIDVQSRALYQAFAYICDVLVNL